MGATIVARLSQPPFRIVCASSKLNKQLALWHGARGDDLPTMQPIDIPELNFCLDESAHLRWMKKNSVERALTAHPPDYRAIPATEWPQPGQIRAHSLDPYMA